MSDAAAILSEQVQATIHAFSMADREDSILVACSGGPDSVCLLHILQRLGYTVHCAHLDHQTRRGASAEDRRFVENLARDLGVPYHVSSRPVEQEAAKAQQSFEAYAREVRYAFLAGLARKHGIAVIATGHHADDQAETVLFRLIRGTSPRGLAGIPPVGVHGGRKVIRPLIRCPKALVTEYLDRHGIAYRDDASNADSRFARNKVRNELLPLLQREYNPRVREALVRVAELIREEDAVLSKETVSFLEACCDAEGGILRRVFQSGPVALQRRALSALVTHRQVDTSFDRLEAAREAICQGATGSNVDLGEGYALHIERIRARILAPYEAQAGSDDIIPLHIPGETDAFGRRFAIRYMETFQDNDPQSLCRPDRQVFDADALGQALAIRRRRAGDRFTPYGMQGTRKLKDYFIDSGVAAPDRDAVPLLLSGDRIAWVVGHAISSHVAITPATRRVLEIRVADAAQ